MAGSVNGGFGLFNTFIAHTVWEVDSLYIKESLENRVSGCPQPGII
jgi:hypothetical protein